MNKSAYISNSLKETEIIAKNFLSNIMQMGDRATVVFLSGNLGAGKTTFTKSLAKALGIKVSVISPTFILEKKYKIPKHPFYKNLIHIDAYRFESPKEAKILDLDTSASNPENLIVIEWPSKLGKSIKPDYNIKLTSLSESSKKISW